jgi:uncharacterized protein
MNFEYDPDKSASNKSKHGIDFEEAKALWLDRNKIIVKASDTSEPRQMVIGLIEKKHWSAVITQRGENIRIISVRRSREGEIRHYESD